MNVDTVLAWLNNVIKTTPDGIIQSLIVGIVFDGDIYVTSFVSFSAL